MERLEKALLRVFRAVFSEPPICSAKCPDLLNLVQSAIKNSPPLQRAGITSIKALTANAPCPPMAIFYHSFSSASVNLSDAVHERTPNVGKLCALVAALYPVLQGTSKITADECATKHRKESCPTLRRVI